MNYRQVLLEKLKSFDFGRHGQAQPVVSLEEFFVGNEDEGSIGCNLDEHPGLPFFFETLQNIRSRADVQDVLVEITTIDELTNPGSETWAFSDHVYIITSASREEVAQWMKPLMPGDIENGWTIGKSHVTAPGILEGNKVYVAWWD